MCVIQKIDVVNILSQYRCYQTIRSIKVLEYYHEKNSISLILKIKTSLRKEYVIKLIHTRYSNIEEEEKRCEFSEFLRQHDMPVPQKYKSNNGTYCIKKIFNNICYCISVEEYFGEDVKTINYYSTYMLGMLLGKMHALSEKYNYFLKFGPAYNALNSGKTKYRNIWKKEYDEVFKNKNDIYKLEKLHNQKINELKKIWSNLPMSAVHADLGLISNFMYKNSYGIIDFNLAGNEVLLGDLLITWYSSRYTIFFINNVEFEKTNILKEIFLKGYFYSRRLTRVEEKYLKKISCILNGIYFNIFVVDLVKQGYKDIAQKLVDKIYEQYFLDDTQIDLKKELTDNG